MQHHISQKRWQKFSLIEQMAHIGSEIERAMRWNKDHNSEYADLASNRALELFDLTLADPRHKTGYKEIARARELWLDFFLGENQYQQTEDQWHHYFYVFAFAARRNK